MTGPGGQRDSPDADGSPAVPPNPGGPLLAVCVGQRCTALGRLAGTQDRVGELRSTVRQTRGAVLVTAACFGPCALAAVAAVAHRDGRTGDAGRSVWLCGIEQPPRAQALTQWIAQGGPISADRPDVDVPGELADAVLGLADPPIVLRAPPRR